MGTFTKEALLRLTDADTELCLSIYLPMERKGAEVQQNPIRFKNIITEAEEQLQKTDIKQQKIEELLKPLQNLVNDWPFWQQQSDGLALFLDGEGTLEIHRLPIEFDTVLNVGDRYYVKPLLPMLSGDGQFYILALSQKDIRLLRGTRYAVDELDLEGMPKGLAEVLFEDQPQEYLQHHTGARGDVGGGAIHHGHSAAEGEDTKNTVLRYFQRIDKHLEKYLKEREYPLVLAGVDYLLPLYREANSYKNLIEEGIKGNPEELSPQELHEKAWSIVEPHFDAPREKALNNYRTLDSNGKTAATLETVVSAAYHGRVDTLFVAVDEQHWGQYDPESNEVSLSDEQTVDTVDLLDVAAVQTLKNGGTVYAVDKDTVPDGSSTAAILRY